MSRFRFFICLFLVQIVQSTRHQKYERRMPKEACAAVFTLYIQNIKLEGADRQSFRLYISMRIREIDENARV